MEPALHTVNLKEVNAIIISESNTRLARKTRKNKISKKND